MNNKNNTVPLAVDMDGCLVKTDVLVEATFAFIKQRWFNVFLVLYWLVLEGKPGFKHRLAGYIDIPVETLPYNEDFAVYLNTQLKAKRPMVLATASPQKFADQVAGHVDMFSAAYGCNGTTNNSGADKAATLSALFGDKQYAYAGNSKADLAVWPHTASAVLVTPDAGVADNVDVPVEATFDKTPTPWRAWLQLCRPWQWAKNALVLVPAVLSYQAAILPYASAVLGMICFIIAASGVYVLNDLQDVWEDRQHKTKRHRPLAAATVDVRYASRLALILFAVAMALGLIISPAFAGVVAGYIIASWLYGVVFKRKALFDVLWLAGLYCVRLLAGAVAAGVALSFWLLGFALFAFLCLALIKRYVELVDNPETKAGRGYESADLPLLAQLGVSSGVAASLVLALYVTDPATAQIYNHPSLLYILCPLALYWFARSWLLVRRGKMPDDPVRFALKDKTSLQVAALAALVLAVAALW